MASRKLAATLGTGTLGAGGAAGAAAWKLGLRSEKSLEPVASVPSQVQETSQTLTPGEPPSKSEPNTRGKYSTTNLPFTNATAFDIKAVNTGNWETVEEEKGGVTIKVTEGNEAWQCTIKGIVFGEDQGKKQSVNNQVKEFVDKVKANEENRKKFVEKCAKNRLNEEKAEGGKKSTIELWVEGESSGSPKLKGLDNFLNSDFIGLKRLENYLTYLKRKDDWGMNVESLKDETKKIVMKLTNLDGNEIFCSVYGFRDQGETKIEDGNFDFGNLTNVLNSEQEENENSYNTDLKKKKFLIRNCLENNKTIEGMKVVFDSSSQKWKFENLEELLLTKMYENPGNTKSQQTREGT